MTLRKGSQLSHYQIVDFLEAGGMGEVYVARDPRLRRQVAIKVLPPALRDDFRARARFEREARAIASLSHPNLLSLYDVGTDGDLFFVVTELLEGETLRQRLRRGPMPLRQVIEVGRGVAEGLAAAHARGVVHRDIKPENLFLTADRQIKILDFGVAAIRDTDEQRDDGATATMTLATRTGEILGTSGYLSPEQARGAEIDHRSDIFTLGCVLYEMLAAEAPFARATPTESLVALLREEPAALDPKVPKPLERLIRQCLEKEPDARYQSAFDVALALRVVGEARPVTGEMSAISLPSLEAAETSSKPPARRTGWWMAATAIAALALGAGGGWWFDKAPEREPPVIEHLTYTGRDGAPATSPDQRLIAFQSDRDGTPRIWLKQAQGGDETPLTEGPDRAPRFSPDGTTVLFIRSEALASSLYRVPTVGGTPRRLLADVTDAEIAPDGQRIAFVRWRSDAQGHVHSVVSLADVDGGDPRVLTELTKRRAVQPRWSPDGRRIALVETESPTPAILLVDTETGDQTILAPPAGAGFVSAVAWDPQGTELLYAVAESLIPRQGGISRVVRHRPDRDQIETLLWHPTLIRALDIIGPQTIVFEARAPRMDLIEVTRNGLGTRDDRWLTRGHSTDRQPTYAPDGSWIVFSSNRSGNLDLWAIARGTGSLRRMTDDDSADWDPAFLPDGRLVWSSNRSGTFEIWCAEPDGSAPRPISRDGVHAENPSPTPDGAWVVYNSRNPTSPGLWKVRTEGGDATRIVAGITRLPEVSPDGRHVLYLTDLRPNSVTLQVATMQGGATTGDGISLGATGGRARWLPDGSGIAYLAPLDDGRLGLLTRRFPIDPDEIPVLLISLDETTSIDSFAFAPEGDHVTYAQQTVLQSLVRADNLAF